MYKLILIKEKLRTPLMEDLEIFQKLPETVNNFLRNGLLLVNEQDPNHLYLAWSPTFMSSIPPDYKGNVQELISSIHMVNYQLGVGVFKLVKEDALVGANSEDFNKGG